MFKTVIVSIFITIPIFASAVSVSVIKPIEKEIAVTIDAIGAVISKNETSITVKTSGLLEMQVSQNSFVLKGKLIAKVSDKPRKKKIELLKQSLTLQKTGVALQADKIKIAKDKYKMGVGSKSSYLAQKILLRQLQEQYNTKQNEYCREAHTWPPRSVNTWPVDF